jgi:hypothetical protein
VIIRQADISPSQSTWRADFIPTALADFKRHTHPEIFSEATSQAQWKA